MERRAMQAFLQLGFPTLDESVTVRAWENSQSRKIKGAHAAM